MLLYRAIVSNLFVNIVSTAGFICHLSSHQRFDATRSGSSVGIIFCGSTGTRRCTVHRPSAWHFLQTTASCDGAHIQTSPHFLYQWRSEFSGSELIQLLCSRAIP